MALTKVTGQVINTSTDVTVGVLTVTNTLAVGGTVSIGGTLTYEDVTNIDSVGLITARNGIVVGSGITLSKDGDGFFTGVTTSTTFVGNLTGNVTGNVTGTASGNPTLSSGADNRVITASSATALTGESNVNIVAGNLITGHTASTTVSDGESPFIQVKSTDSRGGISLIRHSADAAGGGVYIGKSRNATIGSNTVLQNGDELGRITFSGDDGTDIHTQSAAIQADVDGSTGSNDMPGRLVFKTNSGSGNGSSDLTERLRITSDGKIGINGASPDSALSITGTGSDAATRISITDGSGVANVLGRYGNLSLQADEAGAVGSSLMQFKVDGSEVMRLDSGQNVNIGAYTSVAGLRYFDVQNGSSADNGHGSIIRLITSNAAGNSTTSVDMVKYKDGNFFISNNETTGETKLNTGGSTSLNISADGYVTKPKTPFFSVYGTASNITYNDGDEIDFENVYHNVGSHFKTTSGTGQYKRFIAPVTGVYIFTFGFFPNTASNCRIQLNLNGTNITTPYISGCFTAWGAGIGVPAGSQMLKVNAGEYVSVKVSSGTLTNTYDGHTGFQGFLLG